MENACDSAALHSRIDILERRLARGRLALWASLGGIWLAALALVAYSTALRGTLAVRELILVDEAGRHRAFLDVDQEGAVYLIFYDVQGKQRQALGIDAEGRPALALLGVDEQPRLSLKLDAEQRSSLTLADAGGRQRVRIEAAAGPALQTWDQQGREERP